MRTLVWTWLVAALGCGGETALSDDAGSSAKDTGITEDASTGNDAGTPCPPPNLPKGDCVGCRVDGSMLAHVYCGM